MLAAACSHHYDLACGILQSLAHLSSVPFIYLAPRGWWISNVEEKLPKHCHRAKLHPNASLLQQLDMWESRAGNRMSASASFTPCISDVIWWPCNLDLLLHISLQDINLWPCTFSSYLDIFWASRKIVTSRLVVSAHRTPTEKKDLSKGRASPPKILLQGKSYWSLCAIALYAHIRGLSTCHKECTCDLARCMMREGQGSRGETKMEKKKEE